MSPEKGPFQKEHSIATINFLGMLVSFGGSDFSQPLPIFAYPPQ